MKHFYRTLLLASLLVFTINGCVSTVIGVATDAAIGVAKVPFKVGGAVVDVVTDDDDDDNDDKKKK